MASEQNGTSALQRLGAMVQVAKAKNQSTQIRLDVVAASVKVRTAQVRFSEAEIVCKQERSPLVRELESVEDDDRQLKELVRQAAQVRAKLTPADAQAMDQEIGAAREEIISRRDTAKKRLAEINSEHKEAEAEMKSAVVVYNLVRKNLARIEEDAGKDFGDVDQLVTEFEGRSVWGRSRNLREEIMKSEAHFGDLVRKQPKVALYQMKLWIGVFRSIQDEIRDMTPEEIIPDEVAQFEPLFGRLVGISREHQPGYIEAFNREWTPAEEGQNWEGFIESARAGIQDALANPRPVVASATPVLTGRSRQERLGGLRGGLSGEPKT